MEAMHEMLKWEEIRDDVLEAHIAQARRLAWTQVRRVRVVRDDHGDVALAMEVLQALRARHADLLWLQRSLAVM